MKLGISGGAPYPVSSGPNLLRRSSGVFNSKAQLFQSGVPDSTPVAAGMHHAAKTSGAIHRGEASHGEGYAMKSQALEDVGKQRSPNS